MQRKLISAALITICLAGISPAQPTDIGRSPRKATSLSLWTTAASVAVGGSVLWIGATTDNANLTAPGFVIGYFGLGVGPSVGHSYAGKPGRGALGAGIRLFTGAASMMFIAMDSFGKQDIIYAPPSPTLDYKQNGESHFSRDIGIFLAGVTAFSAVYDIATAARSARQYNTEREKDLVFLRNQNSGLNIRPTYFPKTKAPGLLLSWKF